MWMNIPAKNAVHRLVAATNLLESTAKLCVDTYTQCITRLAPLPAVLVWARLRRVLPHLLDNYSHCRTHVVGLHGAGRVWRVL